jgi:hypothetical protein
MATRQMKTIHKFKLNIVDVNRVIIAAGARLLSVHNVGDEAFVWALVDTEAPKVHRALAVHGTGNPVMDADTALPFVGTVVLPGQGVWHVFDAGERE